MQNLSAEDQAQIAMARQAAHTTAEEAYNKLDINGDGEVDREEFQIFAGEAAGLTDGATAEQKEAKMQIFFEEFDADDDEF